MAGKAITVSNSADLAQALKTATGGETIYLAGGGENYSVNLKGVSFGSAVTLKSLDGDAKAVFDSIKLDKVSNLTVDGVAFNSVGVERPSWMTDVFVENSRNITVVNSVMTNVATAFNDGTVTVGSNAVRVKNTDGFVFQNNEVSNYNFGFQVSDSANVNIAKNNIHHLQGDGMQFTNVDKIVVDGNYIHDFYASLFSINHNDMIQFHTSGTRSPSENIVISNNVLDSGAGNFTQGIFFGNEAVKQGAGREMFYKNVLIENNTVHNRNYNGITVYETDGLTIRGNNVLLNQQTAEREFKSDSIYIAVKPGSHNVTVADNLAGKMHIHSETALSNNLTLDYKNPNAENYYLKILDLSGQAGAHVAGIKLLHANALVQNLLKNCLADRPDPAGSAGAAPAGVTENGTAGADTIRGGANADTLRGAAGNDAIHGNSGADQLFGDDGADKLFGGAGNDTLKGGAGNDALQGDDGNDQLFGEDGDDAMDGGVGNDALDGGAGNDKLFGGTGVDVLRGGAGNDAMRAGADNDSLQGGAGSDQLFGEDGDDALFGEDDNDTLDGGAGNDAMDGGAGNDRLLGGAGDDMLRGGTGKDRVEGGVGNDNLLAGADDDTLYGDGGDDALYGEDGSDHLRGGAGNDRLFGGAGNEMLWGEDGDDVLDGNAGRDNYYGGNGHDAFVLRKGEIDDDRILDYSGKKDTIVFDGFGDDASVRRVSGSVFRVEDADGSTAQFRVSVTDGSAVNWVFA